MPVYRYEHTCGFSHDQFLKVDKSSVTLECERCHFKVVARQVRDNTIKTVENNDVVGLLRNERET